MCKKILFPVDPVIEKFAGVKPLADALGYAYQRVYNWKRRGVPALEVATRPDIFAAIAVTASAGESAQGRA